MKENAANGYAPTFHLKSGVIYTEILTPAYDWEISEFVISSYNFGDEVFTG